MLLRDEDDAREYIASRFGAEAIARLDMFSILLTEGSKAQNLVARSTLGSLWLRHIADSAQLLEHVSRETSPWIDLGSGAGFPGLVVGALQPQRAVILIESRRLRIDWLNATIRRLGLTNCDVLGMDVRNAPNLSGMVISARAFAPLPRLIDLSARFSTAATEWVLPRGQSAMQDVAALPETLQTRFHVEQSITDPQARILVARGEVRNAL